MEVDEQEDPKIKRLLGIDTSLSTPGEDAEKTETNVQAMDIVTSIEAKAKNARQLMLAMKSGHGTGVNMTCPAKNDIDKAMSGLSDEQLVDIFGDGSHTTPLTW